MTSHDRPGELLTEFPFFQSRVCIIQTEDESPHLEASLDITLQIACQKVSVDHFLVAEGIFKPDSIGNRIFSFLGNGNISYDWLESRPSWPVHPLSQSQRSKKLTNQVAKYAAEQGMPAKFFRRRHTGKLGRSLLADLEQLASLKELKEYIADGFPVGRYLASSLITVARDSEVQPAEHKRTLRRLSYTFWQAYRVTKSILEKNRYRAVVVFNGRFAHIGGIIKAAREHNIAIYFHERGGHSSNNFYLEPFPPHDDARFGKAAAEYWLAEMETSKDSATRLAKATLNRAREEHGLGIKFANGEKPPSKSEKRRVVYFSSSPDEYESLPDEIFDSTSGTQFEALMKLDQACHDLGLELIVRVHPNIQNKSQAEVTRWQKDIYSFVPHGIVISSKSKTNSYALMDTADLVVVWNSTIGLEALYWGKKVLCLEDSPYRHSGADVILANHNDIAGSILEALDYEPSPASALPYGLFVAKYGIPAEFFDMSTGKFKHFVQPKAWQFESRLRTATAPIIKRLLTHITSVIRILIKGP